MMRQELRVVCLRLAILGVLLGCVVFTCLPRTPTRAQVNYCTYCDTNFATCGGYCNSDYDDCISRGGSEATCGAARDVCRDDCRSTYRFCLDGCQLSGGSGGGGASGCGRGRTSCELDCYAAKQDCMDNGGDTCGEEYQACMDGCC